MDNREKAIDVLKRILEDLEHDKVAEEEHKKEMEDEMRAITCGCVGAAIFYGDALGAFSNFAKETLDFLDINRFRKAKIAFSRMLENNIVGIDLHTLWSSCCDKNTKGAVQVILDHDISEIKEHIENKIPYSLDEMKVREPRVRDDQYWCFIFKDENDDSIDAMRYVSIKGTKNKAKEIFADKYKKYEDCLQISFDDFEKFACDDDRDVPIPKLIEEID
mgnify:CR=1 FL=1